LSWDEKSREVRLRAALERRGVGLERSESGWYRLTELRSGQTMADELSLDDVEAGTDEWLRTENPR
jgi:hypothetical protein